MFYNENKLVDVEGPKMVMHEVDTTEINGKVTRERITFECSMSFEIPPGSPDISNLGKVMDNLHKYITNICTYQGWELWEGKEEFERIQAKLDERAGI